MQVDNAKWSNDPRVANRKESSEIGNDAEARSAFLCRIHGEEPFATLAKSNQIPFVGCGVGCEGGKKEEASWDDDDDADAIRRAFRGSSSS